MGLRLVSRFFPTQIESDSLERRRRTGFLIIADQILLVFYLVIGVVEIFGAQNVAFGVPLLLLALLLVASLLLVRAGRQSLASVITLVMLFITVNMAMYTLPYLHFLELFRYMGLFLAVLLFAVLIGFSPAHVYGVGIASFIAYNVAVYVRIWPVEGAVASDFFASFTAANALLIMMPVIATLTFRFTKSLIAVAEQEASENEQRYLELRDALESASHTLSIGDKLSDGAARNRSSLQSMKQTMEELKDRSNSLLQKTERAGSVRDEMKESADSLKTVVQEEHSAAEENSTAIEQIRTNAKNIVEVTERKRDYLSQLEEKAKGYTQRIQDSSASIREIIESTEEVNRYVSVIEDVADRTNLLALNAAVVAARAGEAGRGFSVVTDEIKSLSDETNRYTESIHAAIKQNTQRSQDAAEAVEAVNSMFEELSTAFQELRTTFSEVIDGIREISSGIHNIAGGTRHVVEQAQQSNDTAESVTDALERERQIHEEMRELIETVNESLNSIVQSYSAIEEVSFDIEKVGQQNKDKIRDLVGELRGIGR
jgi:methyl-accepting chemotaxis protein